MASGSSFTPPKGEISKTKIVSLVPLKWVNQPSKFSSRMNKYPVAVISRADMKASGYTKADLKAELAVGVKVFNVMTGMTTKQYGLITFWFSLHKEAQSPVGEKETAAERIAREDKDLRKLWTLAKQRVARVNAYKRMKRAPVETASDTTLIEQANAKLEAAVNLVR